MSRTYCIRRLLEHGALSWGELLSITGWTYNQLHSAMERLLESGLVEKVPDGPRRNLYCLP